MQSHHDEVADGIGRPDRCLRWPEVRPLVGVSRTTWWRMSRAGTAPKGIRISPNCVVWRASDIAAFQTACAGKVDLGRS